jgi:hypothetical protein
MRCVAGVVRAACDVLASCPETLMPDPIPDDVINNIPDTTIAPSGTHGHGLFAARDFSAGEVLGHLDGQRVPWSVYVRRQDILVIRPFRTRYYYINHSRGPNLRVEESPLRLIALRDIPAGAELLLDYRAEPLPAEYMAMHGSTYL